MRKKREGEVERERKMSKREKNSKKWSILFVAMYLYHDDPVSARPSYTHAPSASSPFIAHHKALMVWLWLNPVRLISIRQLWSPRHSITFRAPSFSLRPLLFFFWTAFFLQERALGLRPLISSIYTPFWPTICTLDYFNYIYSWYLFNLFNLINMTCSKSNKILKNKIRHKKHYF
jgi:hypothetical protein